MTKKQIDAEKSKCHAYLRSNSAELINITEEILNGVEESLKDNHDEILLDFKNSIEAQKPLFEFEKNFENDFEMLKTELNAETEE